MNILLTGASGFLGRYLLPELLSSYQVTCLVRKPLALRHPNLRLFQGDVTTRRDAERCVKDVDCIIHAAASLHGTPQETYVTNVEGTRHLVEAAKSSGVRRFIFISTENAAYDYCTDSYSQSKRDAERFVKTLPGHTILRPSLVYGKDDNRYITYLMSFMKKYPLLPVLGKGTNLIQPLYVDDFVAFVLQTLRLNIQGTHLIFGGDAVSYNTLIDILGDSLHIRRPVVHFPLSFLRFPVFLYEHLAKNPKIRASSLDYFRYDRVHDPDAVFRTFHHHPLTVREGIARMLTS